MLSHFNCQLSARDIAQSGFKVAAEKATYIVCPYPLYIIYSDINVQLNVVKYVEKIHFFCKVNPRANVLGSCDKK